MQSLLRRNVCYNIYSISKIGRLLETVNVQAVPLRNRADKIRSKLNDMNVLST